MRVTVKLFASLRDAVGKRELPLELPAGATAAAAWEKLVAEHPRLQPMIKSLQVAVNQQFAGLDSALKDGDEVAFLPPVSGGQDSYLVTTEPLRLDPMVGSVLTDQCGAVATFLGVVRRPSRGRQVEYLEYQSYAPMAEKVMADIGQEIRERWPVVGIALHHRTGRLEIGQASVAVVISAGHRHTALEACRYAIERLKEIVPVWKKEVWDGGEEWIQGP